MHFDNSFAMLIPLSAILAPFIMIIFLRRFENAERMAMIEKGINPSLAKSKNVNPANTLRFGLLAIGGGIGLLIGSILEKYSGIDEEVAYFSMIFIFGGLGLLSSYIIQLKMDEKEKAREKYERIELEK